MNSIIKHTKLNQKEIIQEVGINKDDMYLNLKIDIEGEEVYNEKAHSLTLPFLSMLGFAFNDGRRTENGYPVPDSGIICLLMDTSSLPNENDTYQNIGATLSSISGNELTIDCSDFSISDDEKDFLAALKYLWIRSTVDSGEGANDGVYEVTDANTDNLYSGSETLVLTVSPTPASETVGNHQFYPIGLANPEGFDRADLFEIIDIRIGNSNTSVQIDDMLPIQDLRARFTNPAHTVDEPVVAASNSKIAITKAFTNNSGSSQTVREVALLSGIDLSNADSSQREFIGLQHAGLDEGVFYNPVWNGVGVPLARDVITDKVVADGETITVTYEFTVSEDGSKGILATFNELMYRQMAQTTRNVEDYNNQNRSDGEDEHTFSLVGGDEDFGQIDTSFGGIQLGTHTGTIDISDVSLVDGTATDTRIPHGEDDGELYYYGSRVKGWTKASSSNAYLDVVAIFENRGSTDVNVNELGFNVLTGDGYPVCIARHVLDTGDRQTLSAGEFLKVTYRFTISTS